MALAPWSRWQIISARIHRSRMLPIIAENSETSKQSTKQQRSKQKGNHAKHERWWRQAAQTSPGRLLELHLGVWIFKHELRSKVVMHEVHRRTLRDRGGDCRISTASERDKWNYGAPLGVRLLHVSGASAASSHLSHCSQLTRTFMIALESTHTLVPAADIRPPAARRKKRPLRDF